MAKNNYVFQRIEKKYVLTPEKYELLRAKLSPYIEEDEFGLSAICNIYFDTDEGELIRRSIDKPIYKEKLRLRSYGIPEDDNSVVYVELKKKFNGIVYKRRNKLKYGEAREYLYNGIHPNQDTQILRETDYFLEFYKPKPAMYIAYDRIATYAKEDSSIRITFDFNIRSRDEKLSFDYGDKDTELLLPDGDIVMEIKVGDAYPLWLVSALSELEIYPFSFSKYGNIYKQRRELCLEAF